MHESAGAVMQLAARDSMWHKKLNARDYVQDGLIAMWDGIENAGHRTHDAAARIWTDLCGNGFDLSLLDTAVWSANSLVKPSSGVAVAQLTNCRNNVIAHGGIGQIECVYTNINNTGVNVVFGSCYAGCAAEGLNVRYLGLSQTTEYDSGWRNSARFGYTETSFIVPVPNNNYARSVSYNPNLMCVNGETGFTTSSMSAGGGGGASYSDITLGASTAAGNYGAWTGAIYCIRLYNKYLQMKEIIHNYEIDRLRFDMS